MFWIVVGIIGVFFIGLFLLFSSLTSESTQFTEVQDREVLEIEAFLNNNINCSSSLSVLKSKSIDYKPTLDIPYKDEVVIVSEKVGRDNFIEVTLEGRLDGQLVTFWIREGNQRENTGLANPPFILYLRGLGPYSDITKEDSLLVRDEFSVAVPFIIGDFKLILDCRSDYGSGPISFQTYVLAKITSVLDYVSAVYDSPKIIAYGEEWGAVLARELALVDPRVNLVISNKFPGDTLATIQKNGIYNDEESDYRFYEEAKVDCYSSDLNSFIGLVPNNHIYLGSSTYNPYYSIGTEPLAIFLEKKYEEAGFPENFTYIELEDLDKTGTEEVVNSIHENLYISN